VSVYKNNFDQDTSANAVVQDSNHMIKLNKDLQFTEQYFIDRTKDFKKWIRVTALFKCTNKEWDLWRQSQFILRFYEGDKEVQANMIRVHRFINDGESKILYLDAKAPESFTKIGIHVWHADSDKELFIDDLEVISFDD
jgi:hypothetical protein